jgi:hypothetical protein
LEGGETLFDDDPMIDMTMIQLFSLKYGEDGEDMPAHLFLRISVGLELDMEDMYHMTSPFY